jgi:hypothetical protein
MHAHWLQLVIDWMGLPALALLAVVLLLRRWYRDFPFFFAYVIGAESVGIARLIFTRAPFNQYSRVYWISDTALAVFAFLAAYELFFKRLFPAFYRTRFYRYLFPSIAVLIAVAVSVLSLLDGHSSVLPATSRVYELLRAAILACFVMLMLVMGRHWDRQEFGVAFGFGLDVSTSLAVIGIWTHTANRNALLGRLSVIAYDIACLIWIYCFWSAPKSQLVPVLGPEGEGVLHEAKKWEDTLKGVLGPSKKKGSAG